jgi:ABC-type transporter Mla subunit MlaD
MKLRVSHRIKPLNDFDELLGRPPARRRAWLFILPAVLGLILVVLGVAFKQGYFIRRVNLNFYAPSADGVAVGTKIKLLGFPVGAISGVSFIPANAGQPRRVKLQANVDAEYLAHIPHDSRARLAQEGVIGEYTIEILPGSDNARPVAAGEFLELKKEGGLGGLASIIESRLMPVVDEAQVLLRNLNDERAGVKPVLAEMHGLALDASATARQAGKMLDSSEAKLDNLLNESEAVLKSVRHLSDATDRRSLEMLDDASSTLKSARSLAEDGAYVARELRSVAPDLIDDGHSAAADAAQIAQGAKRSWPLRWLLDEEMPTLPSLGVDTGRVAPAASAVAP